jgi:hypothetical protein
MILRYNPDLESEVPMTLTRLLCRVTLIASGCASIWAQTAPLVPNPAVPKPFQFDGSQYKGLLPGWPVTLKPQTPIVIAKQIIPGKPCAAARIMRPNPALDPKMIPHNFGSTPMPMETRSRDITEMNVPAPSCADIAAPQELNAGPEKR